MEDQVSKDIEGWIHQFMDPHVFPWRSRGPDSQPLGGDAIKIDPTVENFETGVKFTVKSSRDSLGRFHKGGTITFDNGDVILCEYQHGKRVGDVVIISDRNNVSRLCGTYHKEELHGEGRLVTTDMKITECFFKDGCIHGLARSFELKKFREFRQQLTFLGRYRSGRYFGPCWIYKEGGGFLFGVPSDSGDMTGDNWAYIYPDFKHCWLGKFEDGKLVNGREAFITGFQILDDILVPEFSAPIGESVKYQLSTKTSLGQGLLVRDPYEKSLIKCKSSNVGEEAGEGLFVVKDVRKGSVVAFYNGARLPYQLGGPKEVWETSGYKIFINADYKSGERMDIPRDYVSLTKYCATLGHKMNHSFEPNCKEWFFEHPRFGLIPCMVAKCDISAGQELLLDYEYDPYNCPKWFEQALIQYVQTCTEEDLYQMNSKYSAFIRIENLRCENK